MKTYLYAIRHGETELNKAQRHQGQNDSPLTELGIKQVLSAKKYFMENNIVFDRVYCSPLGRAIQTAELLCDDYTVDEGLIERSFGILEGVSWADERSCVDDRLDGYGGEGNNTLRKRIVPVIDRIMKDNIGKSVLIVGHGGILWQFAEHWKNNSRIAVDTLETPNCTIYKYEFLDGEFYLEDLIYTSKG